MSDDFEEYRVFVGTGGSTTIETAIPTTEELNAEIARLRERIVLLQAEVDVLNGTACAEEQARGKGPCGSCRTCRNERIEKLEAEVGECVWKEDYDGNWETSCNEMFIIMEGTPEENSMRYCTYCGKKLVTARAALGEGE